MTDTDTVIHALVRDAERAEAAKKDFVAGWRCWVHCGYVDPSCMQDTAKGPRRVSVEFCDGFKAAATDNDRGGGERPSDEDAEEAWYRYWQDRSK